MKAGKKIAQYAISKSINRYLSKFFYLVFIFLLAGCDLGGIFEDFEEVEITNVKIELTEPGFAGSIQLGEQVRLIGSYDYIGDDHLCSWTWSCTSPDGTSYERQDIFNTGVSNPFPGEEIVFLDESNCITELRFTPQVAGIYEIIYKITADEWGINGKVSDTETFLFTVVAPTCQFFDVVVSPEEEKVAPGETGSFTVSLENVSDDWEFSTVGGNGGDLPLDLAQVNEAGEFINPNERVDRDVVSGWSWTGEYPSRTNDGTLLVFFKDDAPAGTYRYVLTQGSIQEATCLSNEFVIIVEEE